MTVESGDPALTGRGGTGCPAHRKLFIVTSSTVTPCERPAAVSSSVSHHAGAVTGALTERINVNSKITHAALRQSKGRCLDPDN